MDDKILSNSASALALVQVNNFITDTMVGGGNWMSERKSCSAGQIPRFLGVSFPSRQSISGGSTPLAASTFRRRVLGGGFSFGNREAFKYSVNRSQLTPSPPVSRSLSNSENPRSNSKRKADGSDSLSIGTSTAFNIRSIPSGTSRYRDIMRGRAKIHAAKAPKNSLET